MAAVPKCKCSSQTDRIKHRERERARERARERERGMARGRRREIPHSCKTYGFPLYCASWVPIDKFATAAAGEAEEEKETEEKARGGDESKEAAGGGEGSASEGSAAPEEDAGGEMMLLLGGGGGEGRSGIPNALLVARFDPALRSLSEDPVHRLSTGQDVPYRMALHPRGDGILCSFPNGCRWFEWDLPQCTKVHKPTLKSSEKTLTQLEDVGLQLALTFNAEGSLLASGGEDGHMRIFKWPAVEIILEQSETNQSVKDLDFSSDGKFLASVVNSGLGRVWDLNSKTIVANLSRENGEKFGFCRFSQATNNDGILYTTASHGQFGRIVSWSTISWNRIMSIKVAKDPISAFSVSNDGKLLAVGTIEGDVVILNSSNMQVHSTVKQAHLGLVTTLVFSQDSRTLASASFDSTAHITVIEEKKPSGMKLWVVFFIILLAILVYYAKAKGIL